MNQYDYNNYGQQNFRRPTPYQQQQMMPNFAPPQAPVQGGNFAPRPMNPQVQMQQGMFPNQAYQQNNDTMPGFDEMYGATGDAWKNVDLGRSASKITDAQADEELEKCNQILDTINGEIDTSVAHAGNVPQVYNAMQFIAKSLREPEGWVPTAHANQLAAIKTSGAKVAKVLDVFGAEIAKLM